MLGTVGATGRASGPHLHFELRLRGAAVNPLLVL
jgi:murein DD-endopeptidase MepM/ murein hydrolase activator NlpD